MCAPRQAGPRQAGPRQAQSFAAMDALQAIAGLEPQIGAGAGRAHGVAAGAEDASLHCDRGRVQPGTEPGQGVAAHAPMGDRQPGPSGD